MHMAVDLHSPSSLHSFSPVVQVLSPSNLAYSRGRVTPQALVTLVERHWDSQPQEVPVNLLMTPVCTLCGL